MEIEINDMPSGYQKVLLTALNIGTTQSSRIGRTSEIVGMTINIEEPWMCGVTNIGRAANSMIGALEGAQLIAGEATPELMSLATGRRFDQYRDGEVLHGSYGPRLRNQIPYVLDLLNRDPDTRQAVLQVWDPAYDLQQRRDLPCTVGFQFLNRGDHLDMLTTMRSNDAWRGFAYDVFQFAQLQCTMAHCLDLRVGRMIHRVGSFHLYEEDWETCQNVTSREATDGDAWSGVDLSYLRDATPAQRWETARAMTVVALEGTWYDRGGPHKLVNYVNDAVRRLHGVS